MTVLVPLTTVPLLTIPIPIDLNLLTFYTTAAWRPTNLDSKVLEALVLFQFLLEFRSNILGLLLGVFEEGPELFQPVKLT